MCLISWRQLQRLQWVQTMAQLVEGLLPRTTDRWVLSAFADQWTWTFPLSHTSQGGGRGHKGDSNGVGNDQGGFGNFSESTTGGFSSSAGADDEKWD